MAGVLASCASPKDDLAGLLGLAAIAGLADAGSTAPYTITGTVKGVAGTSITLQNNAANDITITGDEVGSERSFSLDSTAATYDITVSDAGGRSCTVTNGSGSGGTDVANITVDCILNFTSGAAGNSEITGFSTVDGSVTIAGDYLLVPDQGAGTIFFYPSSTISGEVFNSGAANYIAADFNIYESLVWASDVFSLNNGTGGFGVLGYDSTNVHIWNSSITANVTDFTTADLKMFTATTGCTATNFDSLHFGAFSNGTFLIITTNFNNRVMIWNNLPASTDTPPDVILGDAATCSSGTTASTLNTPKGVWSDGTRIAVADSTNSRVMIWNSWPTSNGQAADLVLGQSDFVTGTAPASNTASSLNYPYNVTGNGNQLFVADQGGHRVMVWNSWPTANGQAADVVLGQNDFTANVFPSSTLSNLNYPSGVYISANRLYVSDGSHVVIYNGQ